MAMNYGYYLENIPIERSRDELMWIASKFDNIDKKIEELNRRIDYHIPAPVEQCKCGPKDSKAVWMDRADDIVANTLKELDVGSIYTIMCKLDWRWANTDNKIPSAKQIVECAEKLAKEAFEDLYSKEFTDGFREAWIATGGFEIHAWEDGNDLGCNIRFVVTESEYASDNVRRRKM